MINVVAGIIHEDGKILIARRAQHKSLPGKWEFPGGKIEDGESPEHALERELLEEFNIITKTGEHFQTSVYSYPSFDITLICYYCEYVSGNLTPTDHDQVVWCDPQELRGYDFAEADLLFVRVLLNNI